jgi:hypothetical protein
MVCPLVALITLMVASGLSGRRRAVIPLIVENLLSPLVVA